MDKAHIKTDKVLNRIEKEITEGYNKAIKESREELAKVLSNIDTTQDPKKLYALIQKQKRLDKLINKMTNDLQYANKMAIDIMNNSFIESYGINYNYTAFDITKMSGANIDWNLYNKNTIKAILSDNVNPFELMALDELKDKAVITKLLKRELTAGILRGEGINQIAKRISKVADKKRSDAIRIARTETGRVQNSARLDAMSYASDKGLNIQKTWSSTLDGRTRHSHVAMNGETVPLNESFSNGLDVPCGSGGFPADVCNCRCTMITEFVGLEKHAKEIELNQELKKIEEDIFYEKYS